MQKKLNGDYIDSYCEKFASKVASGFFNETKTTITGKEVLEVTPSKQVNFFVIKLLFRYWQAETKKLESPFFNYKNNEVKKAMVQFMNVLSQHIEINQAKFEVLLSHATRDAIYLSAVPEAYLEVDLEGRGIERITEKVVIGTLKYLKIHKNEIKGFMEEMKGVSVDELIDELVDEFDSLDTTEALDKELGLLNTILTIDPDNIFYEEDNEFDEEDVLEPGEEDLIEDNVYLRTTEEEMDSIIENKEHWEAEEEDSSIDEMDSYSDPDDTNDLFEDEDPDNEEEAVQEEEDEVTTINDQFERKQETLVEHHQNKEVSELLESIAVNDRYMFTKELFGDNQGTFEKAILRLESMESFDDSVEFLVQTYAKRNGWDMQSDGVKELLKVIFRRFR